MSSWSAFGFSGFDPIMSMVEGEMGQHFLKKSQKSQLKYAKQFAQWSAENSPTFVREGLERAGYNPMLALSQGFQLPAFQTTGTPPSLGDSVTGFDPTVMSALQTQKAERELLKAQKKKVEAETGAMSPLSALVSIINTPEAKDAIRGLFQKLFSTDGSQNNPEIPPAPTLLDRLKAFNKGSDAKWSDVGLKDAQREASRLGLEGKERSSFIEKRRREFNGYKASLFHR